LNVDFSGIGMADALQLDFDDGAGRNVVTYQFRLGKENSDPPQPTEPGLMGVNFPRLNLVAFTNKNNAIGWHSAIRRPAKLENISMQGAKGAPAATKTDEPRLYATPLADVRSIDAEVMFEDASGKPPGHVHVDCSGGTFSYRLDWTGDKTDIQELGWRFAAPREADHFSWHRRGYWSYYPPTHIGRIAGTATPDSANVPLTKMERPDAYDFISTKYDCDWASLADSAGRGICARFAPEHRQHCRAGILPDNAGYELVVNHQCSPPRDISSNIVPDYYLTLQKNSHAEASFTVAKLAAR
jgi:hypothetical protein